MLWKVRGEESAGEGREARQTGSLQGEEVEKRGRGEYREI